MDKAQQDQLIRKTMALLGSRTSPDKAAAARKNGRKGGRPRSANYKPRNRKRGGR